MSKIHVQVSETAMVLSPNEPEWQAIADLPGYQGPERSYLLGRTRQGMVHLCVAVGNRWVEASPEEVTDSGLLWLLECTEKRETRDR